jgi:predicted transcriptional regulator
MFQNLTVSTVMANAAIVAATSYPVERTAEDAFDLESLEVGLLPTGSSLVIEARSISLDGVGDHAIHALASAAPAVMLGLEGDQQGFTHGVEFGPGIYLSSMHQSASVSVQGIKKMTWFNAAVVCQGGTSSCPAGGGETVQQVGDPTGPEVLVINRHYETVLPANASATISLAGAKVLLGAPTLDIDIAGWVRLPLAAGATECASCQMPANQTLSAQGNISLRQMHGAEDRIHAQFAADATSVRYDETSVSPTVLAFTAPAAAGALAVGGILLGLKVLVTALFTRRKRDPLEHPRRKAIHDYVVAHPGATFREVAREVRLPAGTARHHLSSLKRAGLLVEHPFHASVRFFENHGKYAKTWRETTVRRDPALAQLEAWLQAHPGAAQKDILDAMEQGPGWSRSTTQHRLARLVAEGLVHATASGRRLHYQVGRGPEPVATGRQPVRSAPAWAG